MAMQRDTIKKMSAEMDRLRRNIPQLPAVNTVWDRQGANGSGSKMANEVDAMLSDLQLKGDTLNTSWSNLNNIHKEMTGLHLDEDREDPGDVTARDTLRNEVASLQHEKKVNEQISR
jgi:hypothetical protein